MTKGKMLVIGSNATRIEVQGGGTGATGQYLNETVVPAMALVDAGYEVVLATPNGAEAAHRRGVGLGPALRGRRGGVSTARRRSSPTTRR